VESRNTSSKNKDFSVLVGALQRPAKYMKLEHKEYVPTPIFLNLWTLQNQ